MRVLISSQYYRPAYAYGGVVSNAIALAEGLARRGHEVTVVTTTRGTGRHSRFTGDTDLINSVRVHYLATWLPIRRTSLNPAVFSFARSHIRDFDVVYIVGLYDLLGPVVASAARRAGIPYGVESCGMLLPFNRGVRLKRAYHSLAGCRMIQGARSVVVSSRHEWDDAVNSSVPAEKLFQRGNGVDLQEYRECGPGDGFRRSLGIPVDAPLVLWLGRIETIKNLPNLLRAIAGVDTAPVHAAIVGPVHSGGLLKRLRMQAEQLGIEKRVHFVVPGLFGPDKLAALASADLLALVSKKENWGNVVLEAIAAGVPVVVTETCGIADAVRNRAGLVVKTDADSIRDGLLRLLTDAKLYSCCKSQLSRVAEEFSWDRLVGAMSDLFESWRRRTGDVACAS